MQIFDILFDIISAKSFKEFGDVDEEKEFSPFLVQRWLSMYSGAFASILNETTNRLWRAVEEKAQWYKLFMTILPRGSRKKIQYLKKNKDAREKKKVDKEVIQFLASHYEMSEREVQMYLDLSGEDIKALKKQLGE